MLLQKWEHADSKGIFKQIQTLCPQIMFLSDEGTMLETLDHTIRIGSTPPFLYFDFNPNITSFTYITSVNT